MVAPAGPLQRTGHVVFPHFPELEHEQIHLLRFDHVEFEKDHGNIRFHWARASLEPNSGHLEPG